MKKSVKYFEIKFPDGSVGLCEFFDKPVFKYDGVVNYTAFRYRHNDTDLASMIEGQLESIGMHGMETMVSNALLAEAKGTFQSDGS